MSEPLLITGGQVVTPDGVRDADVLIGDGTIKAIEPKIAADARKIDAAGCWVMPGFVDLHTHLREPGREDAETIETGTRAAVLGGYSAVVSMPNTEPSQDNVEAVRWVQKRADETALCQVAVAGAITKNREGKELTDFGALKELGVRIFTDDGSGVQDGALMRDAFILAREHGVVIAQHCEDDVVTDGAVMNASDLARQLGVKGAPGEAEDLMVMRDIALLRQTNSRLHFLHISTARAAAMVREAKRTGLQITAEATPHHFFLTHEMLGEANPLYKVNPPLRREQDRVALVNSLRDGTIDVIATDHAPHTEQSKAKSLNDAPPGMIGLETAVALAITELDLTPQHLAAVMSSNPARIAQLHETHGLIANGRSANIAVVDPAAQWLVEPEKLASKSKNTPFAGRKLTGKVMHTIVNGEVVVLNGEAQR